MPIAGLNGSAHVACTIPRDTQSCTTAESSSVQYPLVMKFNPMNSIELFQSHVL